MGLYEGDAGATQAVKKGDRYRTQVRCSQYAGARVKGVRQTRSLNNTKKKSISLKAAA